MPEQAVLNDIQSKAEQLKCHKESPLSKTLPYLLPWYDDCHNRIARGRGLHLDMWRYLFDVLIQPRFPSINFWRDSHQPHELAVGQKAFRLKSQRTGREGPKCCWCIQVFEGGTSIIKEYRLRNTYGNALQEAEEILVGVPAWRMQIHVHQETSLDQADRVPFEDAIVFDMLLDLVTENFEPHTKAIEEGPNLQLEILQLLEKAQQEAVEAAEMVSGMSTGLIGMSLEALLTQRRKTTLVNAGAARWQAQEEVLIYSFVRS